MELDQQNMLKNQSAGVIIFLLDHKSQKIKYSIILALAQPSRNINRLREKDHMVTVCFNHR
jgi:hypothetical protein